MRVAFCFFLLSLSSGALAQAYQVGNKVEVNWDGQHWYKGKVIAVGQNQYKIDLDDYDDNYTQWISADKLRGLKTPATTAPNINTTPAAGNLAAGTPIEILYAGTWYKGTLLEVKGNQYKVRYNEMGDLWDEWVGRERFRTADARPAKSTAGGYAKGDKVSIQYAATWYKGTVLDINGDHYQVRYDDIGPSWDSWVHKDKLKPFTANQTGTKNTTTSTEPAKVTGNALSKNVLYAGYDALANSFRYYYLLSNGTALRFCPAGGLEAFDAAVACRLSPANCGRYGVAGNTLSFGWSNGGQTSGRMRADGGFDMGGVTYAAVAPAGKLAGKYAFDQRRENTATVSTLQFHPDGSFVSTNFGGYNNNNPDNSGGVEWTGEHRGTYAITGFTLTLRRADGRTSRHTVYRNAADAQALGFDGRWLIKQ